ncbi:MAG: hypothetical protein F9K29_07320 [Hyphomicrobiaceae bacterium]|nr:MAG: hypothetical protein F9K29_07320 [Hyphomicrobiaceae bacterium]
MKLTGGLASRIGLACAILLAVMAASLTASQVRPPALASNVATAFKSSPSAAKQNLLSVKLPDDPLWERRWWIEKTARLLRGGAGLGPDDDVDALLQLSEEEIARRFMSDPRFGDAILDFNMFFLGYKADELKIDGAYSIYAFDFANAVAASQALLQGGDYFKLFDLEGEFFMAPLRSEPLEEALAAEDAGLAPDQLRRKAVAELQAVFDDLISPASAATRSAGQELCRKLSDIVARRTELTNRVYRAFNDIEIFALIRGQVISWPFDALERAAKEGCTGRSWAQADTRRITTAAQSASGRFSRAFAEIFKFEPAVYRPQSVLDFKAVDLSAFPAKEKWLAFGFEQAISLQNSSTNFNRKRAAYILRRFFCDDLTPVGFEDPQEHIGGAHGSDTSCFACHYKLDPMGGFFRKYGAQFYDYTRSSTIIFDDLADVSRQKYEATWRARKSSSRKWNIAYVRSPRWESQNSYGETLGDLSKIIRQAPEAKRCLVKRLFEYITAENQTIDGGYLDYLTKAFEAEAAVSSSAAMKSTIVRILQSQTFHARNPDPQQCYDHGPDAKPTRGPPCRVAFILQRNCGQCHGTVYDGGANLDLGAWILAPDGRNQTFPHLDHDMQQLPAHDTLTRILDRLSSSNPKRRMPKNKIMSSQERQELYLWAQQELGRLSKGDGP